MVFVYPGICFGIFPAIYHEICLAEKNIKKKKSRSPGMCIEICDELAMKIPGDHETISIVRHAGLHIIIHEVFFGPLGLHLCV